MAGLVAVGVLAHAPGDVGLLATCRGAVDSEQRVQDGGEALVAAKQGDVLGHVVRCRKTILPTVGFGVVKVDLARIVRREPLTIGAGAKAAADWIVKMTPGLGAAAEFLGDVVVTHDGGHAGDASIVVGVFEGLADRFGFFFDGDEAVTLVGGQAEDVLLCAGLHGFQGELGVVAANALEPGVGDERNGVVADHAVGFVGGQFPHRQAAAVAVVGQGGGHEIASAFALHEGEQGVGGAVGVPQGKHRVLVAVRGGVGLQVEAAVASVGIAEQVGGDEAVVDGGGHDGQAFVAGSDAKWGQGFRPGQAGFLAGGGKVEVGPFGRQIALCTVVVHGRNADLDENFAAFGSERQYGLGGLASLIGDHGRGGKRFRKNRAEVNQLVAGPGR